MRDWLRRATERADKAVEDFRAGRLQPFYRGEQLELDDLPTPLYGMLKRINCEIVDMGVVPDVPDALERAFATAAASADVVITSGGVSVGEADFVKQLLDKLGEVLFWKIAMKPGRPLAYGKIGGAHFFGLPGNPVSVMVTFYEFVRDALLLLQGQQQCIEQQGQQAEQPQVQALKARMPQAELPPP